MLKVKNSSDKAELYIYGDIIDDVDTESLVGFEWPADIKKQLDACKGKPLTIYINSDGGSVPAGVAIANMIARHDAPTLAVVDGWCCSIATQIFFSADKRQMPSNAYLMIHKPSCIVYGTSDDMLKAAESLEVIQSGLEETYKKCALPETTAEEIHTMVNSETWLTGAQAAEKFDIEITEPLNAVAKFGTAKNKMRNIPKDIRFTQSQQTVNNILREQKIIQDALALAKEI